MFFAGIYCCIEHVRTDRLHHVEWHHILFKYDVNLHILIVFSSTDVSIFQKYLSKKSALLLIYIWDQQSYNNNNNNNNNNNYTIASWNDEYLYVREKDVDLIIQTAKLNE